MIIKWHDSGSDLTSAPLYLTNYSLPKGLGWYLNWCHPVIVSQDSVHKESDIWILENPQGFPWEKQGFGSIDSSRESRWMLFIFASSSSHVTSHEKAFDNMKVSLQHIRFAKQRLDVTRARQRVQTWGSSLLLEVELMRKMAEKNLFIISISLSFRSCLQTSILVWMVVLLSIDSFSCEQGSRGK